MDAKKVAEVVLLGGSLVMSLASLNAVAADACTAGSGVQVSGASASFVKTSFTPKCSTGTTVIVNDASSDFFVAGASAKGARVFGGSTAGGGVTMCSGGSSFASPVAAIPSTPSASC